MSRLDAATIAAFAADGYVVTPDALTEDQLDRFGAAVDRAVWSRTEGDRRSLEEMSEYEQSFTQCMRLWETDTEVAPLTFDRHLAEMAAALLGVESVLLWQDQALYKKPGGRVTDPHQDAPLWPVGDAPMITAWIPFDGSTIEGGAMAYVPGSHRAGRLRTVNLLRTSEPYDILNDPAIIGTDPVPVEAQRGSIVWHHGFTVHQAGANATAGTRRVFTIVYLATGHRRTQPWPNFPLDRAGIAVGDEMAGEGLPIAWPRPPGPPPDPPAGLGEPTGPQRVVQT